MDELKEFLRAGQEAAREREERILQGLQQAAVREEQAAAREEQAAARQEQAAVREKQAAVREERILHLLEAQTRAGTPSSGKDI